MTLTRRNHTSHSRHFLGKSEEDFLSLDNL